MSQQLRKKRVPGRARHSFLTCSMLRYVRYIRINYSCIHIILHILDSTLFMRAVSMRFFSCGSTVLLDSGRLTYRRFLELFRHMVGLLGRVISPSQGLCLHRTTQHRKTRTNIHALRKIRTHDPSNQQIKTHASDRTATVTGSLYALTWIDKERQTYDSRPFLSWSACVLPPHSPPPPATFEPIHGFS
jgi:hypothetical protein